MHSVKVVDAGICLELLMSVCWHVQLANNRSGSSDEGRTSDSKYTLSNLKHKLPGSHPHKHRQHQPQEGTSRNVPDVENQLSHPQQSRGDNSQHPHQDLEHAHSESMSDTQQQHELHRDDQQHAQQSKYLQTSGQQRQHHGEQQQQQQSHGGQRHSSEEERKEDWWTAAGLQKPPKYGEEDQDCGHLCPPQCLLRKRGKKKTLKQALQNPTDLFWDAVWIEPEDIIREVCACLHLSFDSMAQA